MREEFEELDEVKLSLKLCEYDSERDMYDARSAHCEFDEYHTNFVNGAWYAWQEQQKKINKVIEHLDSVEGLVWYEEVKELLR